MLNKIGLKNFKAFKNYVELNIKNLTLLSGINSAGKSSIYQALLLLMQSEESFIFEDDINMIPVLNLNGKYINLGIAKELLNCSDQSMIFNLEWTNGFNYIYEYVYDENSKYKDESVTGIFKINKLSAYHGNSGYTLEKINDKWVIESIKALSFVSPLVDEALRKALEVKENIIIYNSEAKFNDLMHLSFLNGTLVSFSIPINEIKNSLNTKFKKLFNKSKFIDILNRLESHPASDEGQDRIMMTYENKEKEFYSKYKRDEIIHIQPFRGSPQRIYTNVGERNPLIKHKSNYRKKVVMSYSFVKNEIVKSSLKKAAEYWIVDYFKLAEGIEIKESLGSLVTEIFIKSGNNLIPINNVGFGISQLLPIIYKILDSGEDSICVVDEPEIHLHPMLQAKLADFFFQMAISGKKIILETHSEYLIDRLIFLQLKYENFKDDISLLWVKREDGDSFFEDIKFDSMGFIVNQPKEFMSARKELLDLYTQLRLDKINK